MGLLDRRFQFFCRGGIRKGVSGLWLWNLEVIRTIIYKCNGEVFVGEGFLQDYFYLWRWSVLLSGDRKLKETVLSGGYR